jgi:hypothetical protein
MIQMVRVNSRTLKGIIPLRLDLDTFNKVFGSIVASLIMNILPTLMTTCRSLNQFHFMSSRSLDRPKPRLRAMLEESSSSPSPWNGLILNKVASLEHFTSQHFYSNFFSNQSMSSVVQPDRFTMNGTSTTHSHLFATCVFSCNLGVG